MSITIAVDSPILSIPEFAKRTGQTECAVAAQMGSWCYPFYSASTSCYAFRQHSEVGSNL